MAKHEAALNAFADLLDIMDDLREKCPWDRKQTLESLRHLTIEETHELSEAILENDQEELSKELGDLLLHIVFYAKIGSEQKSFDIESVIRGINAKLIRRHPHIYGDVSVNNPEEVSQNWEEIKLKEGKKSVLEGVPKSLPALIKAFRIQEKVRGVGFDWEKPEQVWDKVKEEMGEFEQAYSATSVNPEAMPEAEMEFGDLMFALVNYARFIGINPESALEKTNQKFTRRFLYLEAKARASGKSLSEMSLAEMDVFWEEAKSQEKG